MKPILFTPAELEALTLFIAERQELWTRHALDCGVPDPDRVPQVLALEYRRVVAAIQPQRNNTKGTR